MKKALIIGCGGIGSHFISELCRCIEYGQISPEINIFIADNDIVEVEQVKYQNFTFDEAGMNKADALAIRLKLFGLKAIQKRITTEKQLKGYDFIVLCVDNEPTRQLVVSYCFKKDIDFIDLRARGRTISAFPKLESATDNLKFIDGKDTQGYSCQNAESLQQGRIDLGNRIIALIGIQMWLNKIRGMNHKIINLAI